MPNLGKFSEMVIEHKVKSPTEQLLDERSLRPPLKWAGGKRWFLPIIRKYWKGYENRRLVEPFCGGLGVALGLSPTNALLNDANPHLINFYKWIQKGLTITIDIRNKESVYYSNRERFNQHVREKTAQSDEAAQLFYYLNRTGFNGLCRFNLSGEFNVPYGRYSNPLRFMSDFSSYRQRFSKWRFVRHDFEKLTIKPDDFIYADPPYDVDFTTYSRGGFSWEDQERAAEWLAAHPGPVLLSNQATPEIKRLYSRLGFRLKYYQAPRRIRCNGDRTRAPEVLAIKGL